MRKFDKRFDHHWRNPPACSPIKKVDPPSSLHHWEKDYNLPDMEAVGLTDFKYGINVHPCWEWLQMLGMMMFENFIPNSESKKRDLYAEVMKKGEKKGTFLAIALQQLRLIAFVFDQIKRRFAIVKANPFGVSSISSCVCESNHIRIRSCVIFNYWLTFLIRKNARRISPRLTDKDSCRPTDWVTILVSSHVSSSYSSPIFFQPPKMQRMNEWKLNFFFLSKRTQFVTGSSCRCNRSFVRVMCGTVYDIYVFYSFLSNCRDE